MQLILMEFIIKTCDQFLCFFFSDIELGLIMNSFDTVKVLDGGFSSQLSRHLNMEAESTSHPLWCARFLFTDPGSVVKTHRDYIRGL